MAVLDNRIYVLGGRSHDIGNRMKYVHVYNTETQLWESGTAFNYSISGLAACAALLPQAVIGQAKNWEQRTKATSEEEDIVVNSEDSSED